MTGSNLEDLEWFECSDIFWHKPIKTEEDIKRCDACKVRFKCWTNKQQAMRIYSHIPIRGWQEDK